MSGKIGPKLTLTKVVDDGDGLMPRSNAAVVSVNGKLYIWGGRVSDENGTRANDLVVYNPRTNKLRTIEPVNGNDVPIRRSAHCIAAYDNKLYVSGGLDVDGTSLSDLWQFDLLSQRYTRLPDCPQPFSDHCMEIVDGRLYNLVGDETGGSLGTVAVYDIEKSEWRLVETSGEKPGHFSSAHSFVIDKKIYVYGGSYKYSTYNGKLYELDTTKMEWEIVNLSPYGRMGHYQAVFDRFMYIHAGYSGTVYMNDCYLYDFAFRDWLPVDLEDNIDPGRIRGEGCYDPINHLIYIVGGFDTTYRGDIFVIKLGKVHEYRHAQNLGQVAGGYEIETDDGPLLVSKTLFEVVLGVPIARFQSIVTSNILSKAQVEAIASWVYRGSVDTGLLPETYTDSPDLRPIEIAGWAIGIDFFFKDSAPYNSKVHHRAMEKLYEHRKEGGDLRILTYDKEGKDTVVMAHKDIVVLASSIIALNMTQDAGTGIFVFEDFSGLSEDAWEVLLKLLYFGDLDFEGEDPETIDELLEAEEVFQLDPSIGLRTLIEDIIAEREAITIDGVLSGADGQGEGAAGERRD